MASTHNLFKRFNDTIKLTEAKKDELRVSRDAIRDDIKGWLSENGKGGSSFRLQGSFAMNTTMNPINGDEFDIDDGLYLDEYKDSDETMWPASPTAHDWVVSAVSGRTSKAPINKQACVRISYGHGYHVDVPIYIEHNGRTYLANTADGWIESDASGFVDWFNERNDSDGQLKRIVRFLKRWKDYRDVPLKGVELTILAAKNYSGARGRDDDAVRYTVESITSALNASFSCVKPVASWEDLFEGASATKKRTILDELDLLASELRAAADAPDQESASEHLKKVFGEDFPKGDPPSKTAGYVTTSSPAVLKHDGRSG